MVVDLCMSCMRYKVSVARFSYNKSHSKHSSHFFLNSARNTRHQQTEAQLIFMSHFLPSESPVKHSDQQQLLHFMVEGSSSFCAPPAQTKCHNLTSAVLHIGHIWFPQDLDRLILCIVWRSSLDTTIHG